MATAIRKTRNYGVIANVLYVIARILFPPLRAKRGNLNDDIKRIVTRKSLIFVAVFGIDCFVISFLAGDDKDKW